MAFRAPRRVLILRPDNIGDCVLFSGALGSIRRHWPEAEIDLMVQPHVRPLFRYCPHVDRVLSTDRLMPWLALRRNRIRGSWVLERVLGDGRLRRLWYPGYDLVLYPVSAPVEAFLKVVRELNAPEKWGFGGELLSVARLEDPRNQPEKIFTKIWRNTDVNRWLHEIERTRQALRAFGLNVGDLKPELWLSPGDGEAARRRMPAGGVLGLFVGAGRRERKWPPEKWVELIRRAGVADQIVLFGAKQDADLAESVCRQTAGEAARITNLVGRTSLRTLAACLRCCRAVVANDSCGLHFAVASGVPAVGILGGYHFGRFYPWGDPAIHRVANVPMSCYHCNNQCIYGDWRCVRDIPVEKVLEELHAAVGGKR